MEQQTIKNVLLFSYGLLTWDELNDELTDEEASALAQYLFGEDELNGEAMCCREARPELDCLELDYGHMI